MDDRIRAAERSGDRQRLLVELHRAGKPIEWQVGDRVICTAAKTLYFRLLDTRQKIGTIVARYPNSILVEFDIPIIYVQEITKSEFISHFWFHDNELEPHG